MTDIAATAPVHGHADHAHDEHDHKPGFFVRWFMSTNHKDIGTLYLMFAIVAGIVGGVMSGMMRLELAEPGIQYLHGWAQFLDPAARSEEHTSELQSLMRISYAVLCLKKKNDKYQPQQQKQTYQCRRWLSQKEYN